MPIVRALVLLPLSVLLYGQTPPPAGLLERVTESAEVFKRDAPNLLSTETLAQRCYRIPEHAHVALGKAAEPLFAQVVRHEILSEYRVGTIKNDPSGNLFDLRAPFQKDGAPIQTRAAARDSLNIAAGDSKIQKKLLAVLSDLGLLDVATNYGLMLLVFTREGMAQVAVEPVGERYFGAEEAFVFEWRQTTGGLLELSDHKPLRHPMNGELWVRLSDGMPLRITAAVEQSNPNHRIRDESTVEFTRSSFGIVTPLLAVHRHFLDRQFLTENFYTYAPFQRFETDSEIHYSAPRQ